MKNYSKVICSILVACFNFIGTTDDQSKKKEGKVFKLIVNYDRSLQEVIKAGDYKVVDELIIQANFPSNKEEKGKKELLFKIFQIPETDRKLHHETVISKMKEKGCRPATIRELLAFCQAHPDFQKQFAVFALGSLRIKPGTKNHLVPTIWGSDTGGSYLILLLSGHNRWGSHHHFLAVVVAK